MHIFILFYLVVMRTKPNNGVLIRNNTFTIFLTKLIP